MNRPYELELGAFQRNPPMITETIAKLPANRVIWVKHQGTAKAKERRTIRTSRAFAKQPDGEVPQERIPKTWSFPPGTKDIPSLPMKRSYLLSMPGKQRKF